MEMAKILLFHNFPLIFGGSLPSKIQIGYVTLCVYFSGSLCARDMENDAVCFRYQGVTECMLIHALFLSG